MSIRMLRPFAHPSFWSPLLECGDEGLSFPVALGKRHQHADPSHAVWLLARATSGQAAAPPIIVMNSHRRISGERIVSALTSAEASARNCARPYHRRAVGRLAAPG